MKKIKSFGITFWIHLFLIILAYLSPFLFNWKIVLLGVCLIYFQQIIIKGCFLTHAQFGKDPYMTFYYHYLTILGFKVNKKKLKFLMAWIMPIIIFLVALSLQEILGFNPLIL